MKKPTTVLTDICQPKLPLQTMYDEFVNGGLFSINLSQKLLRMIFIDESINYVEEVVKIKKFIDNEVDVKFGRYIVTLITKSPVDELTTVMITRFINFTHKGVRPITLNDKVIYIPHGLVGVEQKDMLNYAQSNINAVKSPIKGQVSKRLTDSIEAVKPVDPVPLKPFYPLPVKGAYQVTPTQNPMSTSQLECV